MTQFPRVHLNGTDGTVLAAEYLAAVEALNEALTAVKAITVHGRDYYPISSEAASAAFAEHIARLKTLQGVRDELASIARSVIEQNDQRRRK